MMHLRVPDFLTEHDVPFQTMLHAPAYTAQRLARYLHTPGRHVAESILLATRRGFYLAVLPATAQIDLALLSESLETDVRIASEAELLDVFRDCERGAATPFGSLYGIPTLLESGIDTHDEMYFEAQWHSVAIRLRCEDYERIEKPRRLSFVKK